MKDIWDALDSNLRSWKLLAGQITTNSLNSMRSTKQPDSISRKSLVWMCWKNLTPCELPGQRYQDLLVKILPKFTPRRKRKFVKLIRKSLTTSLKTRLRSAVSVSLTCQRTSNSMPSLWSAGNAVKMGTQLSFAPPRRMVPGSWTLPMQRIKTLVKILVSLIKFKPSDTVCLI